MNNRKEFLQLQQNDIAHVTFRFPTGLRKEGQFGPYFLYTVVHQGREKLFKATERLEKKLRGLNIRQGQKLSLVKEVIHPKKGEPFTVINIVENGSPSHQPAPSTQPLGDQRPGSQPESASFGGDKQVMFQSLVDAVDITRSIGGIEWRNNDIEKIGVSLFLARTGCARPELLLANGNGNGKEKDLPF